MQIFNVRFYVITNNMASLKIFFVIYMCILMQFLKINICSDFNISSELKLVKEIRMIYQGLYHDTRKRIDDPWPEIIRQIGDPYYNPAQGYEQYWAGGDWVYIGIKLSTTPMPKICGYECDEHLRLVNTVCGYKVSRYNYIYQYYYYYQGFELDEYYGYETFDTYCQFLDAQCRNEFWYTYVLVHLGPCIKNQTTISRPVALSKYQISRMSYYFTRLYNFYVEYNANVSDDMSTLIYPFATVITTPEPPPTTTILTTTVEDNNTDANATTTKK